MLSLAGRTTRRAYVAVNVVLTVVSIIGDTLEPKAALDKLPDPIGLIAAILIVIGILPILWVVAVALPVRRLHDTDRSGWYYLLILLLPYIGPIAGFVWLVFVPGTKGRNRFGADPRGPTDRTVLEIFDGPPVAPGKTSQ